MEYVNSICVLIYAEQQNPDYMFTFNSKLFVRVEYVKRMWTNWNEVIALQYDKRESTLVLLA